MKNWEFYQDVLRKYGFSFAMKDNKLCSCGEISCCRCAFDRGEAGLCDEVKVKFLYQEYKEPVILTDDEKALCRMIGRGWIARDSDGKLWWYKCKPTKGTVGTWLNRSCSTSDIGGMFPQCKFDFIKWEDDEPWEMKVDD